MTVVIGNKSLPTYGQTTESADEQKAILRTAPSSGHISTLGAWLSGGSTSRQCRLVLWDGSTKAVLAYSNLETVAAHAYGWTNVEAALIGAPIAIADGQSLLIGLWCQTTFEYPVESGGSTYEKNAASGVISMSGVDAFGNEAGFYAYLDPTVGVKVRRSGAWIDAPVSVRRGGVWVPAPVKVRRGGAWIDVS